MDIRKVKKQIELLEESGIDELEIHEGEETVRISPHSKQHPHPLLPRLQPMHRPLRPSPAVTWYARRWLAPSTARRLRLLRYSLKLAKASRPATCCASSKP